MKHLNGDKVKDGNGQEWTVWASQLTSLRLGKVAEHCLCYNDVGEVHVFAAQQLVKSGQELEQEEMRV